jgi:hypothetical protein
VGFAEGFDSLLRHQFSRESLERISDPRVHRSSVHAERRVPWERLDTVERIDGGVAIRKHVEKILRTDRKSIATEAIRAFEVGQPLRAYNWSSAGLVDSTLQDVPKRSTLRSRPARLRAQFSQTQTVMRLAALDTALLDAVEEDR